MLLAIWMFLMDGPSRCNLLSDVIDQDWWNSVSSAEMTFLTLNLD